MLLLLSPAKIQRHITGKANAPFTTLSFPDEAAELVEHIRQLSPREISKLLQINSQLTQLTIDRFREWKYPFTSTNACRAMELFDGEVFRGLDAGSLSREEEKYAQQHLRILSGLYGILRPLDLIQPYRLEVSSRLQNPAGKDLYPFWRDKVTQHLKDVLEKSDNPEIILNLASSEYFRMINTKALNANVIDVEFFQYQHDQLRQVVIYTKKARGLMARYVLKHRIKKIEDLKGFDTDGYWYDPNRSTQSKLVFAR